MASSTPPVSRGRNWCFTLTTPSDQETPTSILLWPGIRYVIFQLEKGLNGITYYNGYVQFMNVKRLSQLRKLNSRVYWILAKGSLFFNQLYCTQEHIRLAGPWWNGSPVYQGQRTDLRKMH